ncbi:DNA-binding GntR family transcriptional regulator [Microbacterium resistens]|uniref:DNA-binding GntR family transcriptional regulator n=1 Tax=Microbacterium resistens TaxID=156977 RepID=A0ABU1SAK4_9MICO|nr:GntR family transcriptional regulator [Microbacterium resistens]MDR6866641.1 DNA-binding GntR family transcriptional regulator [Microbacterium resistens]
MPALTPDLADASSVHDRLRQAILSLDYIPGERLTERGLEADLGSSRTPIRGALLRLEAEGLVRREGRGWTTAPIDLAEIRALAEYREGVEVAAIRLACARASDDDLAALRSGLEATDEEDVLGHGNGFHEVLGRLSGNPFLAEAMSGVMTRLLRPRWLEARTPDSRMQAVDEHRAIVDALAARDADAAATLAVAHIRTTTARILATLAEERRRLRGRGLAIIDSGTTTEA